MPFRRTPVKIFQLGNPLYANAPVSFFAIDGDGNPTTSLITLYNTPTGATQGGNPQTLDSNGRLTSALWHDQPFVAKIGTAVVPQHQTAPWYPDDTGIFQGNWVTATLYYVGDTVRDAATGNLYECAIQHLSGTLATDIAAGDWSTVFDVAGLTTATNADMASAAASAAAANADRLLADADAAAAHADRLQADSDAAAVAAALAAAGLPAIGGGAPGQTLVLKPDLTGYLLSDIQSPAAALYGASGPNW